MNTKKSLVESYTPANFDINEDLVDIGLREAVRLGIVSRVKDDQGRDVFRLLPKN